MTPEQKLVEHMLTDHSKRGRPVENPLQAMNVTIQFFLSELISVVSIVEITEVTRFFLVKIDIWFVQFLLILVYFRMKLSKLSRCLAGLTL